MSTSAVSNIRPNFYYKPAANTFRPCPYLEAFDSVVALLGVGEIGRVGAVCQVWLKRVDLHGWKKLFEAYGIPKVVGQRDYKADFKWLYPITLSGQKMAKYFGKVGGKIPDIKQEELDKFKGRNFRVVVVPKMIIRTIDSTMTALTLNSAGSIIDPPLRLDGEDEYLVRPIFGFKTIKNGDGKIPFSLKNLMVLSNLEENKKKPVSDLCWRPAVSQCDSVTLKNDVYLMEYTAAIETKGLSFEEQEDQFKEQGFQVTPLMPRLLFDIVETLESGTFPDLNITVKFSDATRAKANFRDNDIHNAIMDTDGDNKLRIDFDSYGEGANDDEVVVRGWLCSQ